MKEDFTMFYDVEDKVLRSYNRGQFMANLAESFMRNSMITERGKEVVISYFNRVPAEDREMAREAFKNAMFKRGFVLDA